MKRNTWISAALLALVVAPATEADFLTLTGTSETWSSPLSNPSPTFTVGVYDTTVTGTSQIPLFGWTLGLEIVPESGAVGTVDFATATIPTTNYLLGANSLGLLPAPTLPATTIPTIADADGDPVGSGVLVPTTGANLLALTFSASGGAQGVFDILATPYDTSTNTPTSGDGSSWGDANANQYNYSNFSPTAPVPVVLGTLTIPAVMSAVPEPGSALLVLLAAGPMAWFVRRRR